MRFRILVLFFCIISYSASAQWYHISIPFVRHEVLPPIKQVKDHSVSRIVLSKKFFYTKVKPYTLNQSQYSLEVDEASVMKTAQHNMRFRVYNVASYNFSELARIYVQQNRLSEAKWYLLQSNLISRGQNDDKHTIANLISLAMVKANMGEFVLAQEDLLEARDIASNKGRLIDVIEIEKKLRNLQRNRMNSFKPELRYAEAVELEQKALKANQ